MSHMYHYIYKCVHVCMYVKDRASLTYKCHKSEPIVAPAAAARCMLMALRQRIRTERPPAGRARRRGGPTWSSAIAPIPWPGIVFRPVKKRQS